MNNERHSLDENGMPEKIFATRWTWFLESNPSGFIEYRRTTEYTRTDTIPDVAELQRQNEILKKFVRTIINKKRGYGWDKNPWVFVYEFRMIDHAK